MIGVVGTVPDPDFSLVTGEARLEGDRITIQGKQIPVNRGTPQQSRPPKCLNKALHSHTWWEMWASDTAAGAFMNI
jgi:hypothetical protein